MKTIIFTSHCSTSAQESPSTPSVLQISKAIDSTVSSLIKVSSRPFLSSSFFSSSFFSRSFFSRSFFRGHFFRGHFFRGHFFQGHFLRGHFLRGRFCHVYSWWCNRAGPVATSSNLVCTVSQVSQQLFLLSDNIHESMNLKNIIEF